MTAQSTIATKIHIQLGAYTTRHSSVTSKQPQTRPTRVIGWQQLLT